MKRIVLIISFVFMVLVGCEKNDILSNDEQISAVELNVTGLQALGDSAWYELWLVGASGTSSVGVFSVDDQGLLTPSRFDVNLGYIQEASKFLLTVEEDDVPGTRFTTVQVNDTTTRVDTTFAESNYLLAAALIQANQAHVSIGEETVLDFDFMSATGTYMLATPTDDQVAETSGIWFVNDTSAAMDTKMAGLILPRLPARWAYEGWVVFNGTPVSTGEFTNPEVADKSGMYSGDSLSWGYAFPGEDFVKDDGLSGIVFPTDLSGKEVYITLSAPHPANANTPFSLKILSTVVPAGAQTNVVYEMENVIFAEPFMLSTVNIEIKLYE